MAAPGPIADAPSSSPQLPAPGGDAAISRIRWRLMPFLCLLFIVNYLDRTNVAMAKLQMAASVGVGDFAYGLGAGLFFIGYFIFEVPSNLILHRVGARRWIARIMITWGFCSAALFLTRGPLSFCCIRFVLGVAEAGFFPGVVYYLTYWVPSKRRPGMMALFLTSTAVSGLVGNPLAGGLMKLDGVGGLHGWQWLFLLEGLPPVLLGIAMLLWVNLLPDSPAEARWLTGAERAWIEGELGRDDCQFEIENCEIAPGSVPGSNPGTRVVEVGAGKADSRAWVETHATRGTHIADLGAAMLDPRLLLLSVIYFMLVMGLYGFVFWVPTLVKKVSGVTDAKVGLLSGIPYLVAVVTMVVIGHWADKSGRRRRYIAVCAGIGAVGVTAVAAAMGIAGGQQTTLAMIALCVAAIGIFGTLGPFWSLPTRYLRGTAAAGGIAVINSIGALAGFVAPSAIGWAEQSTGHFTAGLMVVAASLAVGAGLVLCVPEFEVSG